MLVPGKCFKVVVAVPADSSPQQELDLAIAWAGPRRLVRRGQHVVLVRGEMPAQPTNRAVLVGAVMSGE
jgi:hypothetical protein